MQKDNEKLQTKLYPLYLALKSIGFISWKGLAFTTGITVFVTYSGIEINGWTPPAWTTYLVVFLVYAVIDYNLEKKAALLMGRPAKDHKGNKGIRIFIRMLWVLFAVRMMVSMGATFMSSPEIAEGITQDTTTTPLLNQIASNDENYEISLSTLKEALSDAKATEAERIQSAKAEGHLLVENAISSRDGDVTNARKSSWWRKQRSPKIRQWIQGVDKAILDSTALVVAAKGLVEEKQSQVTNYIQAGVDEVSVMNGQLTGLIVQGKEEVKAKEERRTNVLFMMDGLFVVVGLFCTFLCVQYEKAFGHLPYRNEKSLSFIVGAWLRKQQQAAVDRIESWLKIDLDGDGKIAGIEENDNAVLIPVKNPPTEPKGTPDAILEATLSETQRKLTELTERVDRADAKPDREAQGKLTEDPVKKLTALDSQELSTDSAKLTEKLTEGPKLTEEPPIIIQEKGVTEEELRKILSEMMPDREVDRMNKKTLSSLEDALRNSYKRGNPSSKYASKKDETREANWSRYLALKSLWENKGFRIVENNPQSLTLVEK